MSTALIIIDQVPLFEAALDACQRACRQIEILKKDLHDYETLDLPAYDRWYNSTFGQSLTQIREISFQVSEMERQLSAIKKKHWARFFGGAPGIHAEASYGYDDEDHGSLHEEDRSGEGEDEEYGPDQEDRRYEEDSFHDDEQESHFDEDEESVRRFEDLFVRGSAWRSNGFQYRSRPRGENGREEGKRRAGAWGPGSSFSGGEAECDQGPSAESPFEAHVSDGFRNRIKERYRALVRKLHPDRNPDLTAEAKSLWNQVQAAYHANNLEQLEVLLALSDAFTGKISSATSLHQLRRAKREVERLIAPMKKKLHQAQEHRAWKFSQLRDRLPLHRIIERELHQERLRLKQKLDQVNSQIARFTTLSPVGAV